jgi:hypothetical protein
MEENKMKGAKISILLLGVFFLLMGFANAADTNICNLNISMINQDPYPAIPGDYVKVVFQVGGVQNPNCKGVEFELIPSYPFSLDNNNGLITLEGSTWTPDYNTNWMIPYTIRVDKDAIDGDSEIKVRYSTGSSELDIQKTFYITIEDARTNFDAVIQESSTSDVSIAIANSGKYTANSVVVRIPEQDTFKVTGTDGQMVGNLDSGDYTIVSFSVSAKRAFGAPGENRTSQNTQASSSKLKFDIYYTDGLGERRIVNMQLPLNMNTNSTFSSANFAGRNARNNGFKWTIWYTGAIIALTLIILGIVIIKLKKRNHHKNNKHDDPDWIKKSKEKEKNK